MDAIRELAGGAFFSVTARDLEETGALAKPDATSPRCRVLGMGEKRGDDCLP
ncbi:MAG TPA: hypothetical protein VK997_02720 [Deferrisomatales bacterium]|nr:hypothetical protein [Deferrisomatales bacterium]